ncbi:MAG TPA: sigma-70 family RNA polymerase sigma factor [Pirellulales bacterium]|nr:sigma-70 family RNA polymerase sigma factor [Pirellulales bacterium]
MTQPNGPCAAAFWAQWDHGPKAGYALALPHGFSTNLIYDTDNRPARTIDSLASSPRATFSMDNARPLPAAAQLADASAQASAAIGIPWPCFDVEAAQTDTPVDVPRDAESVEAETVAAARAAAHRERNSLAKADLAARCKRMLTDAGTSLTDFAAVLTTHEMCEKVLIARCRMAGAGRFPTSPVVDEVLQESRFLLLNLVQHKGKAWFAAHDSEKFLPWVFGVMGRVCRKAFQSVCRYEGPRRRIGKKAHDRARDDADTDTRDDAGDEPSPEPMPGAVDDVAAHVKEAIGTLPLFDRVVVERFYYGKITLKQIAAEMGCSYSKVRRSHTKSLRRFERLLSQYRIAD